MPVQPWVKYLLKEWWLRKESVWFLCVSNTILCRLQEKHSSFSWRWAEYTVWNIKTKPALFRATTPSNEILLIVCPQVYYSYLYLTLLLCPGNIALQLIFDVNFVTGKMFGVECNPGESHPMHVWLLLLVLLTAALTINFGSRFFCLS